MRVVALETGRLTLLADLLEIAPPGGMYNVDVISAVQQRYSFVVLPQPTPEAPQLRFERGYTHDGKPIVLFEIYQQGLVIQTTDTSVADSFLSDLLTEGSKLFGLRKPGPLAKTLYSSSVLVEFEADIGGLLSKSKALFGMFGALLKNLYGIDVQPDLHAITLRPDAEKMPSRLAQGMLADFVLQRRPFAPYESQRFLSTAPLPSDAHVEFLRRLEELAL